MSLVSSLRPISFVRLLMRRKSISTCLYQQAQQLPSIDETSEAKISIPCASNEIRTDYPPKIHKIVEQISQLTLIEVADLNDLLKKTLRIEDAPMVQYGGPPPSTQVAEETEEAPIAETKIMFGVRLKEFKAEQKVALIKAIKQNVEGMNLVQAKKFVESAPQTVKSDISKEEADALMKELEAAGGVCEIS